MEIVCVIVGKERASGTIAAYCCLSDAIKVNGTTGRFYCSNGFVNNNKQVY